MVDFFLIFFTVVTMLSSRTPYNIEVPTTKLVKKKFKKTVQTAIRSPKIFLPRLRPPNGKSFLMYFYYLHSGQYIKVLVVSENEASYRD